MKENKMSWSNRGLLTCYNIDYQNINIDINNIIINIFALQSQTDINLLLEKNDG